MIAQILTPWVEVEGGRYSLLDDVLRDHDSWRWMDITRQPAENLTPDPNLYVVEIECDEKTLAAIEADSRFLVLWSEK